jgi:hypothetical protein
VSKYITVADTAKELRKALKAAFPDQKFSVRSHSYAGGASIDVRYVDGPDEGAVKAVADQFSGAAFDGMIDLKSYHSSHHNGEEVHWGADFVFVTREFSQAVEEKAKKIVEDAIYAEHGTVNPGRFYDVPQEFFSRASIANGGKNEFGSYNFSWRETSTHSLVHIMSSWIANEAWFDTHQAVAA